MIRAWHVCVTTVAGPRGTTVGAETAPEAEAIVAEDLRAMAGLIGPARVIGSIREPDVEEAAREIVAEALERAAHDSKH